MTLCYASKQKEMTMNRSVVIFMMCLAACQSGTKVDTIQPPGYDRYCVVNPKGESILPSGRIVRPAGEVTRITHDPFGLALSPDGSVALAIHSNVLSVIPTEEPGAFVRLPSYDGRLPDPFDEKGSYMGAAIKKDNTIAYLSGGDSGDIIYFDLGNKTSIKRLSINGRIGGYY
jgi:DNA-binding beta-propeller fold protein YncE